MSITVNSGLHAIDFSATPPTESDIHSGSGYAPYYGGRKQFTAYGTYTSPIYNAGNSLIDWDTISWTATLPSGTAIYAYVRSGNDLHSCQNSDWGEAITVSGSSIGGLSGKYVQFKLVLTSAIINVKPIVYSVTIAFITSMAVHFFTANFELPANIRRGLLTYNGTVPQYCEIVFGINTTDSIDWDKYQIIDPNKVFTVQSPNPNLRIGIRLLSTNTEQAVVDEFGILWEMSDNNQEPQTEQFNLEII